MPRQLLVVLLPLFLLNTSYLCYHSYFTQKQILGTSSQSEAVRVTASVDYCPTLYITPEKRIPPDHNKSLEVVVDIRPESSSTPIFTTTVTTDNEGKAVICPIPADLITATYYDVLVKGLSHLRRIFPHQSFAGGAGFALDLSSPLLLAGDSHPTADNYVNSMDVSYEITKLYTNDLRADLNRDTIVNSLEFPTLISHLYAYGDH